MIVHTNNSQWISARGGYKVLNKTKIPCTAKAVQLAVLLSMAADIAIDPGPITLRHVNCHFSPNVVHFLHSMSCDILGIAAIHIKLNNIPAFIKELTPPNCIFTTSLACMHLEEVLEYWSRTP